MKLGKLYTCTIYFKFIQSNVGYNNENSPMLSATEQ